MPIEWAKRIERHRKRCMAYPAYGKVWELFRAECGEGVSSQVNDNAVLIVEAMEQALDDIRDMMVESKES